MKISKKALKQLISEEAKKLERIDLLKEHKKKIKRELRLLKEYDNFNYPSGADADPNAPWNQVDSPEYSGNFEIIGDAGEISDVNIKLIDDEGGTASAYLDEMLQYFDEIEYEKIENYFRKALLMNPRPEGFDKILSKVVNKYYENADVEFERDEYEPDNDPDFERDDASEWAGMDI